MTPKRREPYPPNLKSHESVITPDGTWFGSGWIKIIRAKDSKTGVLQREKELRLLKQRQEELHIEIESFEDQLETAETGLKDAEVHARIDSATGQQPGQRTVGKKRRVQCAFGPAGTSATPAGTGLQRY